MTRKARPNDPCPCGSGAKFKKCCGNPAAKSTGKVPGGLPHTQMDRGTTMQKLGEFIDARFAEECEEAFEELWGPHLERAHELPEGLAQMSEAVEDTWFAFDRLLDDKSRVVDHFIKEVPLSAGERFYVSAMARSSMRFYEVIDTVPGTSITLLDCVEGTRTKVNEKTASRTVVRHAQLVARVIPRGCSGGPEIEMGLLQLPKHVGDSVLAAIKQYRDDFLRADPEATLDDFYKELPPMFHEAWASSIFEPQVPVLRNTDGEEMVVTRVSFHVENSAALALALDGAAGLGRGQGLERTAEGTWDWSGDNEAGKRVSLGVVRLEGGTLRLETNSVERGVKGRALLEKLAGEALRHRATSHEDVRRKVMEGVTAKALGRPDPFGASPRQTLDPDIAEALVAEYYAQHYRAWIDEPVPALDGLTPRNAAHTPAMRSRVVELIQGLEGMYERALKDGQPAYDPSWMWDELDLDDKEASAHPPPLAHERVAERIAGSAEVCRAAAERVRQSPGFEDATTVFEDVDYRRDLELQRFARLGRGAENEAGNDGAAAAPYLRLMVNFELHRRKAFWVDGALSYMLGQTDLDIAGRDVRAPFPSFAIVLSDRHALSLGERLLARKEGDPLRGQLLRVVTAYVTELRQGDDRTLEVTLALDALGADLPSLVRYEVPAGGEASVRAFLDSVAPPPPIAEPPLPDRNPIRGLLRLVLNAILYATSAGVTPELRTAPPRAPRQPKSLLTPPSSSGSVYYLPGKIDIRSVRQMQDLERAPEGHALLSRFLVRGHWRRPQKGWASQEMRWIAPYWKGPDMAAVLERAYRLKP